MTTPLTGKGIVSKTPSGTVYAYGATPTDITVQTVDVSFLETLGFTVPPGGASIIINGGTVVTTPPLTTPTIGNATSIVTGGTAVTVFIANSIDLVGVITNPTTATEELFVNPVTTAGTVEGGSTFGLGAGQSFKFPPSTIAVTANAVTTGHTFEAVVF